MKKIIFLFVVFGLMISCDNNENMNSSLSQTNKISYNQENLSRFVKNHLLISNKIIDLMDQENRTNLSILAFPKNIINETDLINYYKSCNINEYENLIELIKKQSINSENFIRSNPDFYLNDEKIRIQIIEEEINNQLEANNSFLARGSCRDQYIKDTGRCTRNYYIGTGLSVASGFVSFGWSTVIGYAAVQATMMTCMYDAEVDYADCMNQ
jgi:hypothetical protein